MVRSDADRVPYPDLFRPADLFDAERMNGLAIDLVRDIQGEPVTLNVRIFRMHVECWLDDVCLTVFERAALRRCLACPGTELSRGGICWQRTEQGSVAISVDGIVSRWPLADHVSDGLRSRI